MARTVDTWGSTSIPERVIERVMSKVVMGPNGCHVSTYSTGSHGYAQIGWQLGNGVRTTTLCHRAAWAGVHGPIPISMTVDHQCPVRNRRCVNVRHLRLLPNLENARRTDGRDWELGTCINGHSAELWRPKSPVRIKGYCTACRS